MNKELKDRLFKVYELVKNGGTEGEKEAAKLALDRIIERHNLKDVDLDSLDREIYRFKYASNLELLLLTRIVKVLLDDEFAIRSARRRTNGVREVSYMLRFLDYITLEAAYEYFRRHMKNQWERLCADQIRRKRSAKTKNKRRSELQSLFFTAYVIKSKLYKEGELQRVEVTSKQELEDRRKLERVQGGQFNKQVVGGLFLDK